MKKLVMLVVAALAMPAFAQSAKYSLNISDATLVKETTAQAWTPILATQIRTSSQKDLVMNVSMEAGLYTDTAVSSRKLATADANAKATVNVRVLVDGKPATPGDVIFAEREQYLMAQFAGLFTCTDLNNDGIVNYGECDYTDPEILQLWQRTVNANAFTFALTNLQSGIHDIKVEAQVLTVTKDMVNGGDPELASGTAKASAWVGKGAVTVEEVRLVKDQDGSSQIVF